MAGPLFHDGRVVFGPALVRAYQLEQTAAVYPRILVEPAVRALLKQHRDPIERTLEARGLKGPLITRDRDGCLFLDIIAGPEQRLSMPAAHLIEPRAMRRGAARLRRRLITCLSSTSPTDLAARSKVLWLIHQFNERLDGSEVLRGLRKIAMEE